MKFLVFSLLLFLVSCTEDKSPVGLVTPSGKLTTGDSQLRSPGNLSVTAQQGDGERVDLVFAWKPVSRAKGYHLQIKSSLDDYKQSPYKAMGNTYTIRGAASLNIAHDWRVRAINDNWDDNSEWSAQTFVVRKDHNDALIIVDPSEIMLSPIASDAIHCRDVELWTAYCSIWDLPNGGCDAIKGCGTGAVSVIISDTTWVALDPSDHGWIRFPQTKLNAIYQRWVHPKYSGFGDASLYDDPTSPEELGLVQYPMRVQVGVRESDGSPIYDTYVLYGFPSESGFGVSTGVPVVEPEVVESPAPEPTPEPPAPDPESTPEPEPVDPPEVVPPAPEPEPEPVIPEPEPESTPPEVVVPDPEPEPVIPAQPDTVATDPPEVVEPEPDPVIPDPDPVDPPEVVAPDPPSVQPEPEPEPEAVSPEPEPDPVDTDPEPEPVIQDPEPEVVPIAQHTPPVAVQDPPETAASSVVEEKEEAGIEKEEPPAAPSDPPVPVLFSFVVVEGRTFETAASTSASTPTILTQSQVEARYYPNRASGAYIPYSVREANHSEMWGNGELPTITVSGCRQSVGTASKMRLKVKRDVNNNPIDIDGNIIYCLTDPSIPWQRSTGMYKGCSLDDPEEHPYNGNLILLASDNLHRDTKVQPYCIDTYEQSVAVPTKKFPCNDPNDPSCEDLEEKLCSEVSWYGFSDDDPGDGSRFSPFAKKVMEPYGSTESDIYDAIFTVTRVDGPITEPLGIQYLISDNGTSANFGSVTGGPRAGGRTGFGAGSRTKIFNGGKFKDGIGFGGAKYQVLFYLQPGHENGFSHYIVDTYRTAVDINSPNCGS